MKQRTPAQRQQRKEQRWRRLKRYKALLEALIQVLSPNGECTQCGVAHDVLIHHVNGKDYDANKLRMDVRIMRLINEFANGVPLQVLCRSCHGRLHGKVRGKWLNNQLVNT